MIELLAQHVSHQIAEWQSRPEVEAFHRLWYAEAGYLTWGGTRWLGVPTAKCPFDLFVQQDLIVDTKPDLLIETGTFYGGSALFYAGLFEQMGRGHVVTIDLHEIPTKFEHPRLTFLQGSSTSDAILEQLEPLVHEKSRVMAILDSDHSPEHVAKELEIYGRLVSPGCYLVVEDTNISGKPVTHTQYPGGPYPAVEAFLQTDLGREYTQDRLCEHYLLTMHPGGWLRRKARG